MDDIQRTIAFVVDAVLIALFLGFALFCFLLRKGQKKETPSIVTKPVKFLVGFVFFFLAVCIALCGVSIYLAYSRVSAGAWITLGLGAGLGTLSAMMLFMIVVDHEEITKEGYVIYRVGRRKSYPADAVKRIGVTPNGLFFMKEGNKKLFTMSNGTSDMVYFLYYAIHHGATCSDPYAYRLIEGKETKERMAPFFEDATEEEINEGLPEAVNALENDEVREHLRKVGAAHRGRRWKRVFFYSLFMNLLVGGGAVITYFYSGSRVPLILVIAIFALFIISMTATYFGTKNQEARMDDENLGLLCVSSDKETIGVNKRMRLTATITVAVLCGVSTFFFATMLFPTAALSRSTPTNLVTVSCAYLDLQRKGETIVMQVDDAERYFCVTQLEAVYFPFDYVKGALTSGSVITIKGKKNGTITDNKVKKDKYEIYRIAYGDVELFGDKELDAAYAQKKTTCIVGCILIAPVMLSPVSLFYLMPKYKKQEEQEQFDLNSANLQGPKGARK